MNILNNIDIVLVNPLYAGNIGSAARAMKNMGLNRMVLISPGEDPMSVEARKMAVSAFDIIEKASVFSSLEEALAPYHYIVATTTRKRKGHPHRYTARGMALRILEEARSGKAAILFGREDKGLFNDEILMATDIVTIPTSSRLSSLNLSQAVLLVCYEIFQEYNPDRVPAEPSYQAAELQARMAYLSHLEENLARIGFFHSSSRDHIMASLKDILDRSRPSARDIRILRGMLRQLEWHESEISRGKAEDDKP
ncbi:MAG TPA: RNA methyltransferase [Firmicutes bacterium]|nr:RNA methyltransferase [Bacillota bacterium]